MNFNFKSNKWKKEKNMVLLLWIPSGAREGTVVYNGTYHLSVNTENSPINNSEASSSQQLSFFKFWFVSKIRTVVCSKLIPACRWCTLLRNFVSKSVKIHLKLNESDPRRGQKDFIQTPGKILYKILLLLPFLPGELVEVLICRPVDWNRLEGFASDIKKHTH